MTREIYTHLQRRFVEQSMHCRQMYWMTSGRDSNQSSAKRNVSSLGSRRIHLFLLFSSVMNCSRVQGIETSNTQIPGGAVGQVGTRRICKRNSIYEENGECSARINEWIKVVTRQSGWTIVQNKEFLFLLGALCWCLTRCESKLNDTRCRPSLSISLKWSTQTYTSIASSYQAMCIAICILCVCNQESIFDWKPTQEIISHTIEFGSVCKEETENISEYSRKAWMNKEIGR